MTTTGYAHIEPKAGSGRPMIAGTRISVARVAKDHARGDRPEEIIEHYPGLTLGQVHAALAYYYDHKEAMDRQIDEDRRQIEEGRQLWVTSQARLLADLEERGPRP